jgi:RNA methyltransferase, TrmH family
VRVAATRGDRFGQSGAGVITSVDNPRVKEVVRLRRGRERRASGLLVVEGRREVERALAAGLAFRAVYVAPELLGAFAPPPAPRTAPPQPGAEEVSARVLRHMAYRAEPEGIVAVVEAPVRALPANATLVLVAVGVEKPGNLGAMARAADAAGADALLVADGVVDPWNPNAIRASTGAVFSLPIVATTLDELRTLPLARVAAVVGSARHYTDTDLRSPTALIVGAEDQGLDERWRASADSVVSIPMLGSTVDSLNASAAAAVLLFEAVRQRG